jgi:branched-chain amino acid transport system permease protein
MAIQTRYNWGEAFRLGVIAAVVALSLCLIGMVETFDDRDIIGGVISLGQIFLFGPAALAGYISAQRNRHAGAGVVLLGGLAIGVLAALPLVVLVFVAVPLNLREFLPNVSPALLELLTFGQGQEVGSLILVAVSAAVGLVGAGVNLLPERVRRPLLVGLTAVLLIGLLSEIIILAWGTKGLGLKIRRVMFAAKGLSVLGAILVFLIAAGLNVLWNSQRDRVQRRVSTLPPGQQKTLHRARTALGILLLLLLPLILRTYLTEVVNNVGLFILMGFGLNIVVGFAGLLDLGYVAFFAIGAYTMGVLTSDSELGRVGLTFWAAVPFSVLASVMAGVVLGIPVLRMRGDYLAIVTLGFGEIIRILALSDWLAPLIGGAQGILKIPKPAIGNFEFVTPQSLYYIILIGCAIAAFVSWRVRDARLGRQWMAMREDEDVAEAMGIDLVQTKLLAFAMGAAFAGLSGAIFASKLGSVFPHSFNLLISINVLSLIIVGGIGSLPGVVVGALILVGLPELLREFAEYRLLMYGALLIVMMLARPEGFWPETTRRRELHEYEAEFELETEAVPAE